MFENIFITLRLKMQEISYFRRLYCANSLRGGGGGGGRGGGGHMLGSVPVKTSLSSNSRGWNVCYVCKDVKQQQKQHLFAPFYVNFYINN